MTEHSTVNVVSQLSWFYFSLSDLLVIMWNVMFSINTAVAHCCLSERTKISLMMSQFYAMRRVHTITSEQEKCFVWNPQCTTVRQLLLPPPMPNYTLCTWLTYSRHLGPSVFTSVSSFASGPTTLLENTGSAISPFAVNLPHISPCASRSRCCKSLLLRPGRSFNGV